MIVKGAFGSIADPRKIKLLWQHDMREPIGIWSRMSEDTKGLYVEGELNLEVQRGREAYALMKQGAISDMSIGFRTLKSEHGRADAPNGQSKAVRRIKQVKLFEVSLVSVPANPLATVDQVKAARLAARAVAQAERDGVMTEREFERTLRDAGVSRKLAQIMVAEGAEGIQKWLKELLRDAGVSQKMASIVVTGGIGDVRDWMSDVLRDAANLSCKDARRTLDAGYRAFVSQTVSHAETYADDETHTETVDIEDDRKAAADSSRQEVKVEVETDPDETDAAKSDHSGSDRVHPRDADGVATAANPDTSSQSLGVYLAALNLDIGTISGDTIP